VKVGVMPIFYSFIVPYCCFLYFPPLLAMGKEQSIHHG
jgi:hypothetical protein